MTFQEVFPSEQSMWLVAGIVAALFGIGIILWGARVMRQRTVPSFLGEGWHQHLTLALGDLASEHIDDDVIEFAQQQWIRSQGLLIVGIGVGMLVGIAGAFALLQAMVHVSFGLPLDGLDMLPLIPWYCCIFSGFALSGVLAFQRYRRAEGAEGDETLTSGEPSHRVSDYRSPLLVLFAAVPFLVSSTVTLILAPQYVAFSPTVVREYGIVPPPQWILAVYPGALLLMVIMAEVFVWIVAKSPASIRLQNAALAQRFNMGITRQQMSSIYLLTLMSSPQLILFGLQLFTPTIYAYEGFDWPLWLWLLLFFISAAAGLSIRFTLGRMGGRLTGWPWSKKRTQAVPSAEG